MTYLTAGPELSAPTYDRHSVDTIKRLQCIRQVKEGPLLISIIALQKILSQAVSTFCACSWDDAAL